MRTIKARPMAFQEVAQLNPDSEFFVPTHQDRNILVTAKLNAAITESDRQTLHEGVPEGWSVPPLLIQSFYGVNYGILASEVYAADSKGRDMSVVETVGTQVGFTLYAPGLEGDAVLDRVRKALRKEFGPGALQLRQQHHQPVSEMGLPPVFGVPEGQLPRII